MIMNFTFSMKAISVAAVVVFWAVLIVGLFA